MNFLKSKFFDVYNEIAYKNCFVCDFKSIFVFGCSTVTPIKSSCPHSSKPSQMNFGSSPVYLGLSFLVSTILSATCVYIFCKLLREQDSLQRFLLFNEFTMFLCAVSMMYCTIIRIYEKVKELQGIAEVCKHAEANGLVLLDGKFVRKVNFFAYIVIWTFLAIQLLSVLYFFYHSYTMVAFKNFLYNTIFLLEGTLVAHFNSFMMLYTHIFRKISRAILSVLKIRLMQCPNIIDAQFLNIQELEGDVLITHTVSHSETNVEKQIQKLRKLHSSAFWTYKQLNNFMNPSFLMWCVSITSSTTVNIYLVIQCLIYQWDLDYMTKMKILKTYIDMVSIYVFFYLAEITATVVSLQFLQLDICFFIIFILVVM